MSVVVVAGEHRWPLLHGQDPEDLLAEHGWVGEPVRADLDAEGRIQVHYSGAGTGTPRPPVSIEPGQHGSRIHQRVAAYAIVTDGDRLLLSQLADWIRGAAGMWTLPGGGIDPGEHPVDAVVRECHEETGQQVVVDELVQVQSQRRQGFEPEEDFHAVRLIYRAHCPRPTTARVLEVDGSTGAAAWVPLAELDDLPQAWMIGKASPFLPRGDA